MAAANAVIQILLHHVALEEVPMSDASCSGALVFGNMSSHCGVLSGSLDEMIYYSLGKAV